MKGRITMHNPQRRAPHMPSVCIKPGTEHGAREARQSTNGQESKMRRGGDCVVCCGFWIVKCEIEIEIAIVIVGVGVG